MEMEKAPVFSGEAVSVPRLRHGRREKGVLPNVMTAALFFAVSTAVIFLSFACYRKIVGTQATQYRRMAAGSSEACLHTAPTPFFEPGEEERDMAALAELAPKLEQILAGLPVDDRESVFGPHQIITKLLEQYNGDNLDEIAEKDRYTDNELCRTALFGASVKVPRQYNDIKAVFDEAATYSSHAHTQALLHVKCDSVEQAEAYQDRRAAELLAKAQTMKDEKNKTMKLINNIYQKLSN